MAGQDKWYFTKEALQNSPSRRCGIDADKELAYRQQAANFIQDMGQRLHVSQLCINTAIVYMHRFYAFHSFTHFHRNAMAAAALFLAAKMEEQPRKLEYVIKVAYLCLHRDCQHTPDVRSEYYQEQAQDLVFNENVLLQTLGFDVAIDHPHTHVVKTCSLIRASKDLAQTSYFMASNSLHLTTMCLQYKPTVVACFCIHLASKWSNWEIPQSNEGKHWFNYVDKTVTAELLEHLTSEFLHIFDKCPSRLKKKIKSMPTSQESLSQIPGPSHILASSPFDKEPRKILQEESDRNESNKLLQGTLGPPLSSAPSTVNKIDHREYRERQRRAQVAAASAASSGSSGSTSSSASASGSGVPPGMQRPPHRWPHPPSAREVPREGSNTKESEVPGVPHPPTQRRESAIPPPNANTNEHNGLPQRDTGGRERELLTQRDHITQRDGIINNTIHNAPVENVRLNSDVRNNSVRDMSAVSGAIIKESSCGKESMGRDIRDHSAMSRDGNNMIRDIPGQSKAIASSSSSRHNGNVPPQRSSHQRHLPPVQGIPSDSRQRSSQSNPPTAPPRPPQVLPTPPSHPVPPQRPPSLFSPPEPQRKPQINQKPLSHPVQSPILSIPREALIPAPLSPFSSPNEPEPVLDAVENVKKEEEAPHLNQPPANVEPQVLNNLETDPNLVSSLLKESLPHRSEKKKKKEKHKHKDKKDKKEKHKKKDKKRESEQSSNNISHITNAVLPQPIVSNSNNLSIKITLPREAAANIIPVSTPPSISDSSHHLGKLTIKIPKERIKIEPPTPPIQVPTHASTQPQALKIKIPKEYVERENRKRPMVAMGGREGPPTKTSRSQPPAPHHIPNKISHHAVGNGQSNTNYHK